jgi:hypothetical protein
MHQIPEQRPGEPARVSGLYQEVNVLGTATGRTVHAARGECLPSAPRGFGWRLVKNTPNDDETPT